MSQCLRSLSSRCAAAIEFAIAIPTLMSMIWGMFQIGLIFQANAGMQHALGEAARYATIYPTPTDTQIQSMITSHKFGLGNGTWTAPAIDNTYIAAASGAYKGITVSYSQPTDFLFFSGPTVTITKSKTIYLSVRPRPAAFEKAADRLFDLLGAKALPKQVALQLHPFENLVARFLAKQPLRLTKRIGRLCEQGGHDCFQLHLQLTRPSAMAGEADGNGFVDSERLGEQQISRAAAPPREAGNEQRARRFGNQGQIDERH
jgi:hypothetical protein